jgi:GGDEF domain-containing protein
VEQDVAMPMSTRSGELEVGVSVGAVSSVGHACVDELLALADRAMYAIKRGRPRRHVTVR